MIGKLIFINLISKTQIIDLFYVLFVQQNVLTIEVI